MKMRAILARNGQLLGHLDTSLCAVGRFEVTIHNTPAVPEPISHAGKLADTISICRFSWMYLEFRHGRAEVDCYYLVANVPIPEWVWETGRAVKFEPEQWEGAP